MSAQILKEYSKKEIEDLAKEYKLVAVFDTNDKRIKGYNNYQKPIKEHLAECFKRLSSPAVADGYYYFCFTTTPAHTKEPDKYLYLKGQANPQALSEMNNQPTQSKNDLISVQSALNYITEIANLKVQVSTLEMEVKRLKEENAELAAELETSEEEGLSQEKPSDTLTYLKESAPAFLAIAERYFNIEEKKLDHQIKTQQSAPIQQQPIKKRVIKKFEFAPGSEQHLNLIRSYYKAENETALNIELDKLETANPEVYKQIITELNLVEDENSNEQ